MFVTWRNNFLFILKKISSSKVETTLKRLHWHLVCLKWPRNEMQWSEETIGCFIVVVKVAVKLCCFYFSLKTKYLQFNCAHQWHVGSKNAFLKYWNSKKTKLNQYCMQFVRILHSLFQYTNSSFILQILLHHRVVTLAFTNFKFFNSRLHHSTLKGAIFSKRAAVLWHRGMLGIAKSGLWMLLRCRSY